MNKQQIKKDLGLDFISTTSEERSRVRKNEKWGHVDKDGNVVVPLIFDIFSYFENGVSDVWIDKIYFQIGRDGSMKHSDLTGFLSICLKISNYGM